MDNVRVLDSYIVNVESSLLSKLPQLVSFQKYSKIFVITDSTVEKLWFTKIEESIPFDIEKIVVDPGEKAKNLETVKKIWSQLLERKCDRKSLVINLGGGVILDMGGFAASTFMRGIDFLQIPTTLLSMVDVSVGGKVGIDFAGIKNLIGLFNQPVGVIIDIDTLKTLPKREFVSGFGEIIKHGLIANKDYFNFVTSKKPEDFNSDELKKIIITSVKIKSSIVNDDEKESGRRKLLNFGHTIGHAIESLSLETDKPLLHGEAVSIGMVIEAEISQLLKLITENEFDEIKKSLINSGLPIDYGDINADAIIEKIKTDKKSEKGEIKWTLIKGIGQGIINRDIPENIITEVMHESSSD